MGILDEANLHRQLFLWILIIVATHSRKHKSLQDNLRWSDTCDTIDPFLFTCLSDVYLRGMSQWPNNRKCF